jgi:chromate transporter
MISTLLELFWSCTKIGLLAFRGGNAAIPLLESEVVPRWISQQEFGELVGINFAFPGISILKLAGMVGLRAAGTPGLLVAIIGTAWPDTHYRGIQFPRTIPEPCPRTPWPCSYAVCRGSAPG